MWQPSGVALVSRLANLCAALGRSCLVEGPELGTGCWSVPRLPSARSSNRGVVLASTLAWQCRAGRSRRSAACSSDCKHLRQLWAEKCWWLWSMQVYLHSGTALKRKASKAPRKNEGIRHRLTFLGFWTGHLQEGAKAATCATIKLQICISTTLGCNTSRTESV